MTRALAQEKLGYAPAELEALSRQVQMGDLTAVMQIYEEDIKSPVRSAVQGTLLRSLFIQVQKAKVSVFPSLLSYLLPATPSSFPVRYVAGEWQREWRPGAEC